DAGDAQRAEERVLPHARGHQRRVLAETPGSGRKLDERVTGERQDGHDHARRDHEDGDEHRQRGTQRPKAGSDDGTHQASERWIRSNPTARQAAATITTAASSRTLPVAAAPGKSKSRKICWSTRGGKKAERGPPSRIGVT